VVASKSIQQNENLVVIPQSAMLRSSLGTSACTTTTTTGHIIARSGVDLKSLRQSLFDSFEECKRKRDNNLLERFGPHEIWIAIRIMHVLSSMNSPISTNNNNNMTTTITTTTTTTSVNNTNTNNNDHDKEDDEMMTLLRAQAATWPSEEELQSSYYGYWEDEKVEQMWGHKSMLTLLFQQQKSTADWIFRAIVLPLLMPFHNNFGFKPKVGGDFIDDNLPSNRYVKRQNDEAALENTFRYAFGIVHTRIHGGSGHDADFELVPLVDMFNGDSCGIPQSTVNVNFVSGKWPFLNYPGHRGGEYQDACNLSCSCVYATRDIAAGEELILSYGTDMSVDNFMLQYGTVPTSLLDPTSMKCVVSLYCPPDFIPEHQPTRRASLEKIGFPLEKLKNNQNCPLSTLSSEPVPKYQHKYGVVSSYALYTTYGVEHATIGSVRQYLILSELADDFELQRHFSTGRLRGPLYENRVYPLLCRIIDYNLGLLCSEDVTSALDIQQAFFPSKEEGISSNNNNTVQLASVSSSSWERAALLARVAYRETLLMWRHAFVMKGLSAVATNGEQETYKHLFFEAIQAPRCVTMGGCAVCGRSYPCLKCSRCQAVQYCSKGHQKTHWKHHKHNCCGKKNKNTY